MSSETAIDPLEMVDLQPGVIAHATTFDSAARMEEGHAATAGDSTSDNPNTSLEPDGLLDPVQPGKDPKVKVTLWRLLNTVVVLVLGVYKAVAAYGGQQTAPTTLDWILGVLWAVTAYWVSFLEEAQLGPRERWFFIQDHSAVLFPILKFFFVLFVVGLFWCGILGLNWHGFWIGPLWLLALALACSCLERSRRRRRR
ncbi:hypothetical protein MSAN_01186000 [Mycena sanguinolenta]|uniref:Transmembrane protein n=1 Tax=Mycena sanguinolenta TaxID=230812 RepID=A0A8H7D455_9AGAR|nr:hypothetical protein MSAN_01186000 [Mycena sanguinolenta]